MKKTITLFVSLFVFAALVSNAQITNGGFESWSSTNPDGWGGSKTATSGLTITKNTTDVHGGVNACGLTNTTTSHKRFTTTACTVTNGTAYEISFWVKGTGDVRTGMYTGVNAGTSGYLTYNSYVATTSSWAQVTQTLVADGDVDTAQFIISVGASGDIIIDDVNVTVGTVEDVSIYDIQYSTTSPYDSPYNDQVVNTGGIVTGAYENGYNSGFFIQSGSGLWNGILVYCDSATALSVDRGDSVTLTGLVDEYYNLTELKSITTLIVVSSGNAEPTPYAVTGANSSDEGTESVLVKITNGPCVTAPNTYGEWAIFDTDTTMVDNLMFSYTSVVGTHYNVTGVNYYSYGDFFIEPRDASDVEIYTGILESTIKNITVYPNPATDMIYINDANGISMINITNLIGQKVMQIPVSGADANINVSSLPDGIYFISMFNENGIQSTKKFIKE